MGWSVLPGWIIRDPQISMTQKAVLAIVSTYYDDKTDDSYPSCARMGRELGIHPDTVQRTLAELRKMRLVDSQERRGADGVRLSNYWILCFDRWGKSNYRMILDPDRSAGVTPAPAQGYPCASAGVTPAHGSDKEYQLINTKSKTPLPPQAGESAGQGALGLGPLGLVPKIRPPTRDQKLAVGHNCAICNETILLEVASDCQVSAATRRYYANKGRESVQQRAVAWVLHNKCRAADPAWSPEVAAGRAAAAAAQTQLALNTEVAEQNLDVDRMGRAQAYLRDHATELAAELAPVRGLLSRKAWASRLLAVAFDRVA